jgi:hypothetical protein
MCAPGPHGHDTSDPFHPFRKPVLCRLASHYPKTGLGRRMAFEAWLLNQFHVQNANIRLCRTVCYMGTVECETVLWILDIFVRIRIRIWIRKSAPLSYGSGFQDVNKI